jgi:hypothetical protein
VCSSATTPESVIEAAVLLDPSRGVLAVEDLKPAATLGDRSLPALLSCLLG